MPTKTEDQIDLNKVDFAIKSVLHFINSSPIPVGIKKIEKIISTEKTRLRKRAEKQKFEQEMKLVLNQYIKGWFVKK